MGARRLCVVGIAVLALLTGSMIAVAAQEEVPFVGTGGRVEIPEAGFAISLPDDWTYVRTQASDLESLLDHLNAVEPDLVSMVQSQLAASDYSFSLMAFAPVLPGSFGDNLNVITAPTGGMSLDFITGVNLAQFNAMGWTADVTMHDLPVGDVAEIDYEASFGEQDLEFALWIYVDGETQHNVTFTTPNRPDDSWLSIAETFEFLPAVE